jgi:dipeptidase E
VAIGGGKFCDGMARFLLELAGRKRPRVLYIGTAMAENPEAALRMYDRLAGLADLSRLEFFPWPPEDLSSMVLGSDVVFVEGGNTANMLAIWRVHGVDELLREALDRGVILSGSSAGGICWFESGVTDSFGPQLGAMDCLGFLGGSFCPHWDDEELRKPVYHRLLKDGLAGGYAAEAGVGLHFVDGELREALACDEGSKAYRVELSDGEVVETPIEARVV